MSHCIRSLIFGGCLALSAVGFASPIAFDNTTSAGVATVGTGGIYATLNDAATAFNALGSPYLQGDWKLEILNDLSIPTNVGFANTIPDGSSLTLKPAAGTTCTLTFTKTTDNAGPSGNMLVGCYDPAAYNLVPTNHFVVDGSSNGTSSRDLTITNIPSVNHSFATPLVVVGDSDFVTFKNLNVYNVSTTSTSNMAAITAVSRGTGTTGVMLVPDHFTIDNCDVATTACQQGHGILFRISGTLPTASVASITGFQISNSNVQGRLRGIFSDIGMDGTITSNTIACGIGNTTGFLQYGVAINNGRSNTGQILNVTNNQLFLQSANTFAGDFGVVGFSVASAGGTGNTVNFVNNMVNFLFTSSATANTKAFTYQAFRATSAITYNILHNSINMPNFANLNAILPVESGAAQGGSALRLPTGASYTANIMNNIFRIDQAGVAAINASIGAFTATITSDHNIIYRSKSNSYTGVTGTLAAPVNYLTLADWQTSTSRDANSAVVDPTATTGSAWAPGTNDANLHFAPATVKPIGMPTEPFLVDVPFDLDGDTRNVAGTLPGADEVIPATGVAEWNLF